MRTSDAPDKDADRLLQRTTGVGERIQGSSLTFAAGGNVTTEGILLWIHPGAQSDSFEGHASNDPKLAHSPANAGDAG